MISRQAYEHAPVPILHVRGLPVLLDSDLARLYGVPVMALNQAVKRNLDRFPEDFAFLLTAEEWAILKSQIVIATILKRLAEIDKSLMLHDDTLRDIYEKLLPLLAPPPEPPRRKIGFNPG